MKRLVYIINIDWYFALHWMERAKASINNGYDVFVVMQCSDEDLVNLIKQTGAHVVDVNITRKGLNPVVEVLTIYNLFKVIKKINPDIVHTITVKSNLYGSLACMYRKIPFICSVTGMGYAFSNKSMKAFLLKIFIKKFYKLISLSRNYRILFENNDDLSYMVRNKVIAAKNAIRVSGSGVDCDLYSYQPEPVGVIKILCAGRMLYDKGIPNIIEAARILKSEGIDCEIHLAGILDTENLVAIPEEELIDWHNEGLITWLGQINEMPDLISSMHIALLPTSYGEGIPRFLIESAACGRPIITTDVAGCREIVDHEINGLLIEVNNTMQLVDSLKRLIQSKETRERMGRAGRQKAQDEYSQEKVIAQTLEAYDELFKV